MILGQTKVKNKIQIFVQSLEPEYVKAGELLKKKGSDVRLAKIDATIENDLAVQYNVEGIVQK